MSVIGTARRQESGLQNIPLSACLRGVLASNSRMISCHDTSDLIRKIVGLIGASLREYRSYVNVTMSPSSNCRLGSLTSNVVPLGLNF